MPFYKYIIEGGAAGDIVRGSNVYRKRAPEIDTETGTAGGAARGIVRSSTVCGKLDGMWKARVGDGHRDWYSRGKAAVRFRLVCG